jgi:hypothetical protein
MPIWKKKEESGTRFYHLCATCNERLAPALTKGGWIFFRDSEPVSCTECALHCGLTAQGLWGAEDLVRYKVCEQCTELAKCALKGRYFC